MSISIDARFPQKLKFLFKPARYKCVYGGRGSGKSWGMARALLILGLQSKIRVLCTREIQKSIKQSVHQLLSDQIADLGLSSYYEILETEIRGINGTEFYFSGLSNETASSLKSFEGVTHCWCEEAQTISKRSWDILVPTIRAEMSEIWITYNPELESDETHERFVLNPPADCVTVKMNYSDNPWFPKVLEAERIQAQATMSTADYDWVWEGKCKPAVEGAIYFDQIADSEASGKITNVPYDPLLKVQCIWDLGWNDAMVIVFAQKSASALHVIDYIEDNRRTYDDYMLEIKAKKYNIAHHWLPHDGFSKDPKSGKTVSQILTELGASVMQTPSLDIEDGIKLARQTFGRIYFDKTKAARLIECLKRYRRNQNKQTLEFTTPRHDEFSHGCLPAGEMVSLNRGQVPIELVMIGDEVVLPAGGTGKVVASGVSGYTRKLIEITCSDGKVLTVTPNHKMLTDSGIVLAKDLNYNSLILINKGMLWHLILLYLKAANIGLREAITHVTTSGMQRRACYTETFGLARMAQFLKGFTSIMWMKINVITNYPIYKLFLHQNTSRCMEKLAIGNEASATLKRYYQQPERNLTYHAGNQKTGRETQSAGLKMKSLKLGLALQLPLKHLLKHRKPQKSGIQAQKVLLGTVSMEKKLGITENLLQRIALFAIKSTARFTPLVQSSATKIVKLQHLDVERQPVYNLTVEKHHCYLANGMLVSNSDAFRYLAVCADQFRNDERNPVKTVPRRFSWKAGG